MADVDAAAAWHHDDSKLEERASQVTLNAEGGLETSAVTPGPTPTEDLDDPYVDNFMAALRLAKGVRPLMIITRADNSNTVVYAANVTGTQTVDESKPIDYFWADIEPKTSDVSNLSLFCPASFLWHAPADSVPNMIAPLCKRIGSAESWNVAQSHRVWDARQHGLRVCWLRRNPAGLPWLSSPSMIVVRRLYTGAVVVRVRCAGSMCRQPTESSRAV